MKCNEHEQIEIFHKGELHGEAADHIQAHLEKCEDCQEYLLELQAKEVILSKVKNFKPALANPEAFRNEVLKMIGPARKPDPVDRFQSIRQVGNRLLDGVVAVLVQPITRYSFISAAVIIFGVFIYQQAMIMQKISSLEKRVEMNIVPHETKNARDKNIEAFFKRRSNIKIEDMEFNELLDDYRFLVLKHKVLLKALQEKYPEIYQDILKELEEADIVLNNVNI